MNERELGAAMVLRKLLVAIEATEATLFKAGFRDLSSAVYQSRLRISEELRTFERDNASPFTSQEKP